MKKKLANALDKLNFIKHFRNMEKSWQVALAFAGLGAIILFIVQAIILVGYKGPLATAFWAGAIFFLFLLSASLITLILVLIKKIPSYKFWLGFLIFLLFLGSFFSHPTLTFLIPLFLLTSLGLAGGLTYRAWTRRNMDEAPVRKVLRILTIVISSLLSLGFALILILPGSEDLPMQDLLAYEKTSIDENINLDDPTGPGPYEVKTLTYGSPNNYREIFNQEDSLISHRFDGSDIVEGWTPLRTKSLGFGPDQMPLNGLVWYPEGQGPFPLILFVHGNHQLEDFSDPGYAYLAELLASRGYICVSIDENFINISLFDNLIFFGLENDNIIRTLLLLEHIKLWDGWANNEENPFYKMVDMDNIALVGHSRGGEAVCLAYYLNNMEVLPSDSSIKLDYGYNIKALVDIAGTDGSYLPEEESLPLKDVNFLALHGSHDMDVSYYMAYNQYDRINFSEDSNNFKASVYIYGANHGQFNEGWGKNDSAGIGSRIFNTNNLLAREDQEKIAQVYISALMDASLKNEKDYQIIFQDRDYCKNWLPETIYITDYWDADSTIIANFNEDYDLSTASYEPSRIRAENFTKWTEEAVNSKYWEENYRALRLDWDHEEEEGIPIYEISLGQGLKELKAHDSLVFSLADHNDEYKKSDPLTDLSIQIEDSQGNTADLSLSDFHIIYPRILGDYTKMPLDLAAPRRQTVFQNFTIPLEEFERKNEDLDIEKINKISFVFDKNPQGSVYIRDIGIRPAK